MKFIATLLGFLWWSARKFHQKKLKTTFQANSKIWVVGAHQVGGAGRTLLTAAIASELQKKSMHIEVLCHSLNRTAKTLDSTDRFPYVNEDALYIYKSTGLITHTSSLRGQWLIENSIEHLDILLCDGGLEDPNLKEAYQIRLNPPQKIRFSDLLPLGRFRSRLQDHRAADLELIEGKDYEIELKIPLLPVVNKTSEGIQVITAGGNPQAWLNQLKSKGITWAKHHKRKDHDPNFYPFIFYLTQNSPHKNFLIGPKEASKIPKGFKRKNLFVIASEVKWLNPNLPWLRSNI